MLDRAKDREKGEIIPQNIVASPYRTVRLPEVITLVFLNEFQAHQT
jgi:hypothetical protein